MYTSSKPGTPYPAMGGLVVTLDVLGESLPGTGQTGRRPAVHYFGPDLLEWQDLE